MGLAFSIVGLGVEVLRMVKVESYLGLAIALWGALSSGLVMALAAWLLQIPYLTSVGLFTISGLVSGVSVAPSVVRKYRAQGLPVLKGSGGRWGALAGLINAMIVGAAFMVAASGHDASWDWVGMVVAGATGLVLGGGFGLLFGLIPGALCGMAFEAAVWRVSMSPKWRGAAENGR